MVSPVIPHSRIFYSLLDEATENNLIQYFSKYNPEALTQCCLHSIVYMNVQNTEPNVSSSRLWSE
eukprot:SAG31_NODE_946_length_10832_cov_105.950806_6_plen_65_part_00